MDRYNHVLIFSHSQEDTVGTDDELLNYLLDKVRSIRMFKFPFLYSSDGSIRKKSIVTGLTKENKSLIKFHKPEFISYLKDTVYAFFYSLFYIKNKTLVVCTDNILFIGSYLPVFLCRVFGKKITTVYYVIDYTPRRFQNNILNYIYEVVDKMAFRFSDYIWTLSQQMVSKRIEDKGYSFNKEKLIVTPHGNNSHKYANSDFEKYNPLHIAYLGGVFKSKGSELFTGIVKRLIDFGYRDVVLHVIGGGDLEQLRFEIGKNKLEKNIIVYGRVSNQNTVEEILLKCGLAIAPYNPYDKNSFSFYADPGKVKIYLGCGLPVVITKVPEIYKDIEKNKAGIAVDYNIDEFYRGIVDIFSNIITYRKEARDLGLGYSWNVVFDNSFKLMLE